MRRVARCLVVSFACLCAAAAGAGDLLFDAFVATDPVAEAKRAFDIGDRRHLVVPVCVARGGEVLPGWPTSGPTPPGYWAALEQGLRPFDCDVLGDGPRSSRFQRLLKHAEQYNRTLLELERR